MQLHWLEGFLRTQNIANFIYDNIAIQNNIIHSCYINNIKNLIFLGSSCIYPKIANNLLKKVI